MSDRASLGGFRFGFGTPSSAPRREGGGAMHILVMGDFSGREERGDPDGGPAIAGREVYSVDIDEFERVMARAGAAMLDPLAPPEDALPIEFRSLDDFHPDRLLRRVEAFSRLRSIRARLEDDGAYEAAAGELRGYLGFDPGALVSTRESKEGAVPGTPIFAEEDAGGSPGGVEAFVRSVVGPHVVKGADARRGAYVYAADAAISALMRRLMHAPVFKTLESNWRGLHRLITSVEVGERLSIHLLDISRGEMIVDLAEASRAGSLVHSGLYKQILEAGALPSDDEGWGLLAACMTFDRTVGDAVLLNGLAQLAAAAGTTLVAGAGPSLVGCESFADGADPDGWAVPNDQASHAAGTAWEMLRNADESRYVALGMPRVLVRPPYGAGGEQTELFRFEELPKGADDGATAAARARHEGYLWGNPAMTMAEVLSALYMENGWTADPGAAAEVIGLPVHGSSLEGEGEKRVMACAETWMTERGAGAIRGAGVTPLMSSRGRDALRIPGIIPLGRGGGAIAGRWR